MRVIRGSNQIWNQVGEYGNNNNINKQDFLLRVCKNYGKNANPCNPNCKFLHLNDHEIACLRDKSRVIKKDAKTKAYDNNNRILFKKGVIKTYNFKEKRPEEFLFKAAGIIPYCTKNGKIKILVGYERVHKSFKLFGGMRDVFKDENVISTACREMAEEIYGVFHQEYDILSCKIMLESFITSQEVIWNRYHNEGKYLAILLPVKYFNCTEIENAMNYHRNSKKKDPYFTPEKSDFTWVDLKEILTRGNMRVSGRKECAKIEEFDYSVITMCAKTFKTITTEKLKGKKFEDFIPLFHKKKGSINNFKPRNELKKSMHSTVVESFEASEKNFQIALKGLKDKKKEIDKLKGIVEQYKIELSKTIETCSKEKKEMEKIFQQLLGEEKKKSSEFSTTIYEMKNKFIMMEKNFFNTQLSLKKEVEEKEKMNEILSKLMKKNKKSQIENIDLKNRIKKLFEKNETQKTELYNKIEECSKEKMEMELNSKKLLEEEKTKSKDLLMIIHEMKDKIEALEKQNLKTVQSLKEEKEEKEKIKAHLLEFMEKNKEVVKEQLDENETITNVIMPCEECEIQKKEILELKKKLFEYQVAGNGNGQNTFQESDQKDMEIDAFKSKIEKEKRNSFNYDI